MKFAMGSPRQPTRVFAKFGELERETCRNAWRIHTQERTHESVSRQAEGDSFVKRQRKSRLWLAVKRNTVQFSAIGSPSK